LLREDVAIPSTIDDPNSIAAIQQSIEQQSKASHR
jgi:hypothetical protein